jgi:hypothetical protein
MAQQPYMGSGLLLPPLCEVTKSCAFVAVGDWPTTILSILMYPPGSQETWVRNGGFEFSLRNIFIHAVRFFYILRLRRKWCSGFLSLLKIHRPRSGSNPRNLGPVASMLTTSPPRSTINLLLKFLIVKVHQVGFNFNCCINVLGNNTSHSSN